ncbi:MAG: hypothetical protein U0359_11295 [Byssovorax sp.]
MKSPLSLALSLVLTSMTGAALAACPCDAPSPPAIRPETVRAALDDMLRAEGLAPSSSALPVIRRVDLDGDPRTEEAIVDVISSEHCDVTGLCMSIVVAARCDGLKAVGHGRFLQAIDSRSSGWMDVGESGRSLFSVIPVVVRALHWNGVRYGG